MKKLIFFTAIFFVVSAGYPCLSNGEVLTLKNGNKLDYGITWEKDGVVWFYFHDHGVAGITKEAIAVDEETPPPAEKESAETPELDVEPPELEAELTELDAELPAPQE